MTLARKLTAPLSAILLILVAGLAFAYLQRVGTEYPPPILDPQFELWVSDSEFGGGRPLVWELEYLRGSGDQILLQKTEVGDKSALEFRVFQDGGDGWVYVYLRQSIDGARLRALLNRTVGVLVFLETTCACKRTSPSQSAVFGIETNDGEHTLSFLFSESTMEPQQTPSSRTIFLPTVPGEWAYHRIDVAEEYKNAKWRLPERLRFGVTFQAPASATGWHVGYLHGFSVSTTTRPITAQSGAAATTQSTAHTDALRISERGSDVINPPCSYAWNCPRTAKRT